MNSEAVLEKIEIESREIGTCAPYGLLAGVRDEMYDESGKARPHWETYVRSVDNMGCEELERRHQEIIRLLRENGIAYNIHGDPQGVHRNYRADVVPLIIEQKDWELIESGLGQRARLLNLVLLDLYGERKLIADGLIPMELIFRHNGFLRPCQGIRIPAPHQLLFYSADLARGPDGRLWVMKDLAGNPTGLGYTLENRTAMANVLPDQFRDCKVLRLSNFFRSFRSELASVAPFHREQPRVVILTPGPKEETYFEHAYLAAYLGYPLVQGEDLTVRDGGLWLKSLEGLQAVDVVFRQMADADIDSLELNSKSRIGVPGFLEAVRQGSMTPANPPGTGLLENPGLMPFLPAIFRHLLGEDPILPSVNTWWCGQKNEMDHVLENISRLVIKTIHPTENPPVIFGPLLSREETCELKDRIRATPYLYAGQESMRFSTAPSFVEGQFVPKNLLSRHFIIARQDNGYEVMPGGIARSVTDREVDAPPEKPGGILKDVWVVASQPQKHVSLWIETARPDKVLRRSGVLTSRTAENLFWVGRYSERAETLIHLLRTTIKLVTGSDRFGDEAEEQCLQILLRSLGQMALTRPATPVANGGFPTLKPEEEIPGILLNTEKSGSLSSLLRSMINGAYAVRDHWSNDTWQVINALEGHRDGLHNLSGFVPRHVVYSLNRLVMTLMAFTGLCMESMSREPGWVLLDIGRRLERALMFIGLIRRNLVPHHPEAVYNLLLEAVLVATENIITYRRRYRSYLELDTVLDLLLLDENNPRSLMFQLNSLRNHVKRLPSERDIHSHTLSEPERLIFKSCSRLRLINTDRLTRISEKTDKYNRLEGLLASIKTLLERAAEAISQSHFSHTQEQSQLAPANTEQRK